MGDESLTTELNDKLGALEERAEELDRWDWDDFTRLLGSLRWRGDLSGYN